LTRGITTTLKRFVTGALAIAAVGAPIPSPRPVVAAGYVIDTAVHAPPATGTYAYYATYGVFGPDQSGFPRQGETFVDPVFGSTIKRLTNEMGQRSESEIYSKNGYFNANGTLVHHRSPSGHDIISTSTGQVVRASVAFNYDSSFAPDDPDAWYHFAFGDTTLYKYSVSTGNRTAVKTFPGGLASLGGSVDWIDRTGRYMVLNIGGATRVYDKTSDTLYSGSIPGSYGSGGGWMGISPDGNYVITSTPPTSSHSWKIDHASKSVSSTPVLFWTLCGGHGDVMSGSNGRTYFVTFDCNSSGSIYAVDVTLPQSPSNVAQQLSQNRKLVQLASWSDVDGHFSRVSKGALQDWVFASVESADDGFSSSMSGWRAFKQEILMMNALTGEVRRLAHHRSRECSNYYAQPRVSSTWDGSIVAWTSNFGYSGSGYADLFALSVAGGGGTTSGGTTSGGTTSGESGGSTPTVGNPTVAFSNPASGSTVSGTVTVSLSATGGSGGYTYALTAGGTPVYTGTNSGFSWNTSTAVNGSVTLTATVTDSGGRTGSASRTVTVSNTTTSRPDGSDTVPPTVSITAPRSGVWTGNSIDVRAKATDNVGLARIELWGGGKVFATIPCSTTTCAGKILWITGPLPAGAYLVNAVAVDKAGNRATSAPITIYKDATSPTFASGTTSATTGTTSTPITTGSTTGGTTTADTVVPTAAITSPPSGTWTGNSLDVSLRGTDNVAMKTVQLYANGVLANTLSCASASCSGTVLWMSGSLPDGKHTLTAVSTDSSGNRTTSAPITIYK
jgi:hypothetical protein